MIPVQILNQYNNVHAEGDYDGVNLRVITQISLLCSQVSFNSHDIKSRYLPAGAWIENQSSSEQLEYHAY